jgi:hypothetical protein
MLINPWCKRSTGRKPGVCVYVLFARTTLLLLVLFLDSLCKEVANSFDCVGRRAEIVPLYIPKFVTLLLSRSHKTSLLVEEPCPPHLIAVIYKEHPIFTVVKGYGHEMNLA